MPRCTCHGECVARLKTLSLRTLLTSRDHVPLRTYDRIEHLLERFRVTFNAACISKGTYQLQRGNLVFWLQSETLHSVELTRSPWHEPCDLVDWFGFSMHDGDPLAWCRQHDIVLSLDREENGSQLWLTPSGALIALQDGELWNITLVL